MSRTDSALNIEYDERSDRTTNALPSLARVLFLVVAMTVWAEVNDHLRVHYQLGRFTMVVMRTIVDCGGVVWLGCLVWGKQSLRDLGWRFQRPFRLVLVGLLQVLLLLCTIFGIAAIFYGPEAARELGRAVATTSAGEHVFFGLLGLKIGFWEETLFRGDLLRALELRIGPTLAVLASAAIFALYHLGLDDLAQGYRALISPGMLAKFIFGAMHAFFAIRTRSLLPGAIAHALMWAIMCNN